MAWTDYDAPTDWLSGYVLVPDSFADAGDTGLNTSKAYICIPIDNSEAVGAGLGNLTEAEANGSSGDVRKVIYELLESMYQWYNGIATGSTPSKLTVTRSAGSRREPAAAAEKH